MSNPTADALSSKERFDPTALAKYLARKIFECGDDPGHLATRIEFKSGVIGKERAQGGFVEPSFAGFIERLLRSLPPEMLPAQPPSDALLRHFRQVVDDYDERVKMGVDARFGSPIGARPEVVAAMRSALTKSDFPVPVAMPSTVSPEVQGEPEAEQGVQLSRRGPAHETNAPPCIFRSGCVNGQPCKDAGHCTEGAEWKRRLGVSGKPQETDEGRS